MKLVIGVALTTAGFAAVCQLAQTPDERAKEIDKSFAPFSPAVKTRHDDKDFIVESNGMPDHELMTGIVAWQQQVPLPQPYVGANAWRFPLFPKPATAPMSAKTGFFRGAIAIAANGVPIFNPIKNDGKTDTLIAGELDRFGGHGGRADDYHYHIAPLHLVPTLGEDTPIAYALDGYALYGLNCEGSKPPLDLDEFNGHTTAGRGYHYHSTKTYPYLNGGFHGEIVEKAGQVDPQPQARGVRPSLPPLRGAKITAFNKVGPSSYDLTYELKGSEYHVTYNISKDGVYTFEFVDPDGTTRTETYRAPKDSKSGHRPWIYEHVSELDTNHDKTVTLSELDALVRAAYSEVAGDKPSVKVEFLKQSRPARNVIGGYLKQHADEFDEDNDQFVTLQEVLDEFASLMHKADKNHDHALTAEEYGG